jgi:hypothetical protein
MRFVRRVQISIAAKANAELQTLKRRFPSLNFKTMSSAKFLEVTVDTNEPECLDALNKMFQELHPPRAPKECLVCYDPCQKSLETCLHAICAECGPDYISTSEASSITCCDPGCSKPLMQEDISSLSSDTDAVCHKAVNKFLLSPNNQSVDGKKKYCPCRTPDCPQLLNAQSLKEVCVVCRIEQCGMCSQDPHEGLTCARADALMKERASYPRHVSFIRDNLMIPQCPNPNCRVSFLDFSGCFAVTCTNCQAGLCGYCLVGTEDEDPHQHVGRCEFRKKHFPETNSNPFFPPDGSFVKTVSIVCTERIRSYLRGIVDLETRRLVIDHLKSALRESQFPINPADLL